MKSRGPGGPAMRSFANIGTRPLCAIGLLMANWIRLKFARALRRYKQSAKNDGELSTDHMDDDLPPAMPFPAPSSTLLEQASRDAPNNQLRSWIRALPNTIQTLLNRWHLEWTGESFKQGYVGYVLPCRCADSSMHSAAFLCPCFVGSRFSPIRHRTAQRFDLSQYAPPDRLRTQIASPSGPDHRTCQCRVPRRASDRVLDSGCALGSSGSVAVGSDDSARMDLTRILR
jgi:hypothetical protein